MDWLVTADGRNLPLSRTQSLLLDTSATFEDLATVVSDLQKVIATSQSVVADSRRWRRIRQSGLRAVVSED